MSTLSGTCHCGAVRLDVPGPPPTLILCNCSICRRYGALWAFYPKDEVRVAGHPEHTEGYVWGDRTITTLRCRHCGCVTHWDHLPPKSGPQLSVNMRNFDPAEVGEARLRRFDGAHSWSYLD